MAQLGAKVSWSKVSSIRKKKVFVRNFFTNPKKHVFVRNFLTKPAPYHFSGANWLYGAFGGKIVPDENFTQFCLKSPLEFVFPKDTFTV